MLFVIQKSVETGCPIRVVRGANADSMYAPPEGYRYDGMYIVKNAYLDKGISGHTVCKFVLEVSSPLLYLTLFC